MIMHSFSYALGQLVGLIIVLVALLISFWVMSRSGN